jgi:hypothetical protein
MCPMNHSATHPLFVPFMSRIEATVSPGDKTGQVRFVPFAVAEDIGRWSLLRSRRRQWHPHDTLAFPGDPAARKRFGESKLEPVIATC